MSHLKKYIEKEKIPIQNEDDLNLCIKCLSFLFKNKELKYGFSDGAMYMMYYSDNVLGNINYSSLVKYIHNQISKDEIDLTQFFNEFEESHLILNQNYEYGSNNYKILYELLNFCFSYSSMPEIHNLSYLNALVKLKDKYSRVINSQYDYKLIDLCIVFYKLLNSEAKYIELFDFITLKIESTLSNNENNREVFNSCVQFLNYGLSSSFSEKVKNKTVEDNFNIFHNILMNYNSAEINIKLSDIEIEKLLISTIDKSKMEIKYKYSILFESSKKQIIKGLTYYIQGKEIQAKTQTFILQNINFYLETYNPNKEIILYDDFDGFKFFKDVFYFKINKTRLSFSFEISLHTEVLVSENTFESASESRDKFYFNLYDSYLLFLDKVKDSIKVENQNKFNYIREILENEIEFNKNKQKFETRRYTIEEFNTIRKKFGFLEFHIKNPL